MSFQSIILIIKYKQFGVFLQVFYKKYQKIIIDILVR